MCGAPGVVTIGLVFQRPGTPRIPSEYLFKNLATLASVSPIWTRGTTLEGEETASRTFRGPQGCAPRQHLQSPKQLLAGLAADVPDSGLPSALAGPLLCVALPHSPCWEVLPPKPRLWVCGPCPRGFFIPQARLHLPVRY